MNIIAERVASTMNETFMLLLSVNKLKNALFSYFAVFRSHLMIVYVIIEHLPTAALLAGFEQKFACRSYGSCTILSRLEYKNEALTHVEFDLTDTRSGKATFYHSVAHFIQELWGSP